MFLLLLCNFWFLEQFLISLRFLTPILSCSYFVVLVDLDSLYLSFFFRFFLIFSPHLLFSSSNLCSLFSIFILLLVFLLPRFYCFLLFLLSSFLSSLYIVILFFLRLSFFLFVIPNFVILFLCLVSPIVS